MALTATATTVTKETIFRTLGMQNVDTISRSPDQAHFKYIVRSMSKLQDTFSSIAKELKRLRLQFPRLLIFCTRIADCSNIYELFANILRKEATEPVEAPNLSQFRLMDMYTSVTPDSVKKDIEKSIVKPDSTLRVLVCTNAFGMGIDCNSVRTVIHWRPPVDLECYMQKTGRGGRDGQKTEVQLHYVETRDFQLCSEGIREYCIGKSCRRRLLMCSFVSNFQSAVCDTCDCCDICELTCTCP